MQHLEVIGVVRPIYGSLGVKRLIKRRCCCREIMKYGIKNTYFVELGSVLFLKLKNIGLKKCGEF